ncbi:hypothetical protein G3I59_10555 [Amycolatopsis rubida]|uniref:Uncharacterized protein n=1 Tax=Amycolatopsis rubida TaxID=112413 RepID=A0A1I5Y1Z1_9PSEU|nr:MULTISPECIES: hypothetical protein [Amycolatopsis]MYW91031.1 hypothetical protein [Amycolatopsis rubida]NEC56016.1 hypothetical protein [Amycolatopsis rubida]OAP22175.1 hypothetical protein A4R44_06985 [Amycolatopsis sp. M39]SFQ38007.1 hypothetical protein SAMN05421854_111151 [Amycolatopsis rubida]
MDQPAADAGTNWLPDFTITGTGAAPPGPGFTMSRDDARSMLSLAKRARQQFRDMQTTATTLLRIVAPADDIASTAYQSQLIGDGSSNGAFGAGVANVHRLYAYADELVQKLEKALDLTEDSEAAAANAVKNAASGDKATGLAG